MWHRRIREELGIAGEDGQPGRAVPPALPGRALLVGLPGVPGLEDNAKCAELVGAERIGVEVNEESSWQFHPEQTTAAIICHHPQAKYFVVRGDQAEQRTDAGWSVSNPTPASTTTSRRPPEVEGGWCSPLRTSTSSPRTKTVAGSQPAPMKSPRPVLRTWFEVI